MRIKPFQAIYPNMDIIASTDTFFGTVKYDYRLYEKSGFFRKSDHKALYIYEIKTPHTLHRGVVATVDIRDYSDGNILKHEDTLLAKEQAMMNLLLERKAMIKPVLLAYPKMDKIDEIINTDIKRKSLYKIKFEDSNEVHRIWKITNQTEIDELIDLFKAVKKTYIADGHHRVSTSERLHQNQGKTPSPLNFSELLCVFFSFDQLVIHDYNRIVEILNEISPTRLMAELSRYCKIKAYARPIRPRKKHEMSLYINREWYKLTWKKSVLDRYGVNGVVLDSGLVNDLIMGQIMKIDDVRSDKRVRYIEGTKMTDGIRDACIKNENRIGIGLYPVTVDEFQHLSDIGQILPPKSTWFEPRIKNGLISQDFQA